MTQSSLLDGKTAVVTGSSRGIGRGIAQALLEQGCNVVLSGRSESKGQQALTELGGGTRAAFVATDVTDQAQVERLIKSAIDQFGGIDILVNNAGGSSGFAPVAELGDAAWQEAAAWILHSAFWATRAALADMSQRGWGRIINIGSVEGRQANKMAAAHYITFKHALNGFTKAVAFEYGATGITCNAVSPGAVETDLMKDAGPAAAEAAGITYEAFLDGYAQEASIKRLNTVEEVAEVVLLLAGRAGAGINGAIVPVDGGTAL